MRGRLGMAARAVIREETLGKILVRRRGYGIVIGSGVIGGGSVVGGRRVIDRVVIDGCIVGGRCVIGRVVRGSRIIGSGAVVERVVAGVVVPLLTLKNQKAREEQGNQR
jgi:hypothetical protein